MPHKITIGRFWNDSRGSIHDVSRRWLRLAPMSCCVMDVCRPEDRCFAGSAQFENVLNRRDFKDVMNVLIFLALSLTSFQCLWAKRSFYGRSRIGEPTERNNGSSLKNSDIDVLDVGKSCFEEPHGAITASLRWMWIDPGGYWHTNVQFRRRGGNP
jgi:hypothetical protein